MSDKAVSKPFRLWSIRFSHYVEKARWAMDLYGVPYVETPMMPILHWSRTPFVVGLRSFADSHSSRFSTPIVKTDDGVILSKSGQVMRYVSERFAAKGCGLFQNPEAEKLDAHYSNFLGPHTRRLFYWNVLNRPAVIFDLADKNVGAIQAAAFRIMFQMCKDQIMRGLGISEKQVEKGIGFIWKEIEMVERRLSDGRTAGKCKVNQI